MLKVFEYILDNSSLLSFMHKQRNILLPLLPLLFFANAFAHPLGNFSINHFSRIEVERSQIKLRSILDVAEIPTFQLASKIDINQDKIFSPEELNNYAEEITPEYVDNLFVTVNQKQLNLRPIAKKITIVEGSGGLPTLRIVWDLIGEITDSDTVNRFYFENRNNKERIGWNEIIVQSTKDVHIFNSTVFGSGITDELKAYPQENINAPLAERTAEFSFTSGAPPPNTKLLQNRDGHSATPVEKDRFAELINVPEITFSIGIVGIFLAFAFGSMHALSPGHGKTVVGAYLVGSRGTFKHAIFLGLTVTITHTISVFALGLIALFASNYILPESLMPLLSFGSGLMVLFIGLTLFKERLFSILDWSSFGHGLHSYGHKNDSSSSEVEKEHLQSDAVFTHTHGGSTHTHAPPAEVSWRNLLGLGISGGLLPCPSALVLMLSAISVNRIGYGLFLTLIFSFGLAVTLTLVGLIFLYVGKFFGKTSIGSNRIIKALPVLSAFVIACVGALICYNSIM